MPLHIEKELNAMLDRGFSPELVEKLVACRQARWKPGATSTTKSGNPCSGRPDPAPDPPAEGHPGGHPGGRRQIYPLLAKFAFHNGLLTGFQQHFSPEPLTSAFLELVNHQVLERTRLCPPYQRAKEENNTLSEQLRQELEDPAQNLWIELDLLWEDLEYGLALEAFHLGYRAALHTLKAAVGHDAVTGMLHDILLTEYDLGVLRTSMEQERMDAAAPPEE
mgnify:CR=1 FL=1